MHEDEYNSPIKESISVNENKQSQEFSSVKEYDKQSKEFEQISETGKIINNHYHKPSNNGGLKLPIYIFVGAVAGGIVIAAGAIEEIKGGHSEIIISEVGENYVSFNYETNDENLVMKIHNDFEEETQEIDYSEKDEDGLYKGSYTFSSLKSNTNYVVSLDGKMKFGTTARVSKRVKTLAKGSWKDKVKTSYDYSKLNEEKLLFSVEFDGLERSATNYAFKLFDNNGLEQAEVIYENYEEVYELSLPDSIINGRIFTLNLRAEVDGQVEDIVSEKQDLDTILTRFEDVSVNVDTDQIYDKNLVYFELQFVDTLGYYPESCFSATIQGNSQRSMEVNFEGHLHDKFAVSLDALDYAQQAEVIVQFEYKGQRRILYNESIDTRTVSWRNKVQTTYDYSWLTGAKAKLNVSIDGLEWSTRNWVINVCDEHTLETLTSCEYAEYNNEFEIDLSEVLDVCKYRIVAYADILGMEKVLIFDEVQNFSEYLTPIENIRVTVDNSKLLSENRFYVSVDYVDVYGVYSLYGELQDHNDRSMYDFFEFFEEQGTERIGYTEMENLSPAKKAYVKIQGCANDTIWKVFFDEEVDFYRTSLPSEILVTPLFSSASRTPQFLVENVVDLEEPLAYNFNTLTAYISVDESPGLGTWTKTYSADDMGAYIVDLSNFLNFDNVRFRLTISYFGETVTLYNQIVAIS